MPEGDTVWHTAAILRDALAGKTLTQISAGLHVCALDRYGAAYCWGENGYGQLGDGAVTAWADDPKTVVSFVPQPPGHLTVRAGSHTAAVSWTAPRAVSFWMK